ncbi:hypothetical protein WA026_009388 [Henosepilachna vigintioctopunctata]|uniref:Uncharacterized protein n=1 Tax=Henosepilachna vigintioctopunctata TaxID=420089 RepID=A0AAW1U616_9CUCU
MWVILCNWGLCRKRIDPYGGSGEPSIGVLQVPSVPITLLRPRFLSNEPHQEGMMGVRDDAFGIDCLRFLAGRSGPRKNEND